MKIHVCFGINDCFCQHCAATIASILYNSDFKDDYVVHIISDYISDKNKQRFKQLKSIRKFKLDFIKVDSSEYCNLNVDNSLGSSAFYRFKAFNLKGIDKILYLDVDTIVRRNIAELYKTNVDGYFCAGAEDLVAPRNIKDFNLSPTTTFINSGMILINVKYSREHNAFGLLQDFVSSYWDRAWNDQAIINRVFQNKILPVDITWNYTPYPSMYKDQKHFEELRNNPAIIHYIGFRKPWNPMYDVHLKSEYFKYLYLTPWYEQFILQYKVEQNDLIYGAISEIKDYLSKSFSAK